MAASEITTPGITAGDHVETMFRLLVVARTMETIIAQHVREHGFSGWWHPGRGQEGALVGACAALRDDDYLYYQGRGAWAVAKGMDPARLFGDLFGRATGYTRGKGAGIPHWADPAIGVMGEGGTLGIVFPLAAGAALAAQLRGSDQVALADFGGGTASRGTFHETLLQASVWKLPLVYFCENNGFAVSTRFDDQSPTASVAERGCAYGVDGTVVDGHDPIAVRDAVTDAVERVRAGGGPSIVEARVTRLGGHWEGDVQQYRDRPPEADYRDPLDVLRSSVAAGEADRIEAAARAAVEGRTRRRSRRHDRPTRSCGRTSTYDRDQQHAPLQRCDRRRPHRRDAPR